MQVHKKPLNKHAALSATIEERVGAIFEISLGPRAKRQSEQMSFSLWWEMGRVSCVLMPAAVYAGCGGEA
jgi:hypothetical protein